MSGLLAILDPAGGGTDPALFARLAGRLEPRAPDGLSTHLEGPVALARAKLDTGSDRRRAGLSASGSTVLSADARLDQRQDLRRELEAAGLELADDAADEDLVLEAWELWGDGCPARLRGDFAFVVWDGRRRRLTVVRDAFGVRPLYYAELPGGGAVVSNSLAPILAHPRVGGDKDPLGVLDYLLFDGNFEAEGTLWKDVRRVPPGGFVSWGPDGRRAGRHTRPWTVEESRLPADERAHRLWTALGAAVADRARSGEGVSISMSGGLDSTAVAASARDLGLEPEVHTLVYERAIPDREGEFAALAASHLGLRHLRHPMDDYALFERWEELPWSPMPGDPMVDAIYHDFDRRLLRHGRVVLTGWGGDPLFLPERGEWRRRLRTGRLDLLVLDFWRTWRAVGRLPPLGLHTAWRRRRERSGPTGFPPWLRPEFVRATDAEERWRRHVLGRPAGGIPNRRDEAHRHTFDLQWCHVFERIDAGNRGLSLERRHPFFDRRVVEEALAAPTAPWCVDKYLLRRTLRGRLPEAVRKRPKAPQAGDPKHPTARNPLELWRAWVKAAPELEDYVAVDAVVVEAEKDLLGPNGLLRPRVTASAPWRRPLNLAAWMARGGP